MKPNVEMLADGLVGVEEAAALVGMRRRKLDELLSTGVIPSMKPGKRRMIPKRALLQWAAQQVAEETTRRMGA